MNPKQVAKLAPAARLALKSEPRPNGCIEWTGGLNNCGYGQTSIYAKHVLAHRLAFELANGPIPAGVYVLHTCDNRVCVNPDHLWLGSQLDNVRDAITKGRMYWQVAS